MMTGSIRKELLKIANQIPKWEDRDILLKACSVLKDQENKPKPKKKKPIIMRGYNTISK